MGGEDIAVLIRLIPDSACRADCLISAASFVEDADLNIDAAPASSTAPTMSETVNQAAKISGTAITTPLRARCHPGARAGETGSLGSCATA